jgi:hypothetical protein
MYVVIIIVVAVSSSSSFLNTVVRLLAEFNNVTFPKDLKSRPEFATDCNGL